LNESPSPEGPSAASSQARAGDAPPSGRPKIVLVAALARDRTIGKDGGIPWRFPEDMRWFKMHTTGTALVMGRKTWASIGRPLLGRDQIVVVVSRAPAAVAARHPGVGAVGSLGAAIDYAASRGATTLSVIGGGEIYEEAMPLADEMLLTHVPHEGGGDVLFPAWHDEEWEEAERWVVGRCVSVRYRRRALRQPAAESRL
jgi:dihydrofolate reductase